MQDFKEINLTLDPAGRMFVRRLSRTSTSTPEVILMQNEFLW